MQFLLLGKPMNEVAVAEGDAGTGEIVISPTVHDLLHNFDSFRSSPRGGAQDSPVAATASPSPTAAPLSTRNSEIPKLQISETTISETTNFRNFEICIHI